MPRAGQHSPSSVVGIGASAGGLEALIELLSALPTIGMSLIVVQHLDPTHESLLSEILATKTALPVSLAIAGEALRADHVYVIPADSILTVHDGLIELKPRAGAADRPFPVDVLFSSLAVEYAERAIGVVLSGGDSDGSQGVREIKHAGGFTFAQLPESARFPSMPRHAIETECVDLVLRPNEIARELVRLGRGVRPAVSMPEIGSKSVRDAGTESESARLAHIFQRLRSAHGVDFTHYKRTTIKRRIERRMMLQRVESLDEYGALIDEDSGEVDALYQDFLIRVTEFFRDRESFEALRRNVFPVSVRGPVQKSAHPDLGAGLRDRRRGLFRHHRPARVSRRRSAGAQNPGLRDGRQRSGAAEGARGSVQPAVSCRRSRRSVSTASSPSRRASIASRRRSAISASSRGRT